MANRIRGITVEIGGDTTKLDKALKGTNKQLSTTQTTLKDVERLLKLDVFWRLRWIPQPRSSRHFRTRQKTRTRRSPVGKPTKPGSNR